MVSSIENDWIFLWPKDRTLIGTITPGQSGPGNEGALYIPQSSRTGASPSDGLMSYPGHVLGEGSYNSAEMQSAYSTVPANLILGLLYIKQEALWRV